MEPVTHMLTGACLSRACGFPARARYATAACVIAAELPDADYIYRLGGPLVYFQHHRGWTHALWSLPLQAALVVGIFFWIYQTRSSWKRRRSRDEPAPVQWFLLWLMALLALCSHLLLDWTNNYGIRPFAPFNAHWYAGSLVFIVEPLLLLFLGGALLLPLIFSLVHREMNVRRTRHAGRGIAVAALLLTVALWIARSMRHADADLLVRAQELRGGPALRTSINPYPVSLSRWFTVAQTPTNIQTGVADLKQGLMETEHQQVITQPTDNAAMRAARVSWLGRVYLDWSQCPLVLDRGTAAEVHPGMTLTPVEAAMHVVSFSDLRFGYNPVASVASDDQVRGGLNAEAWVDAEGRVVRLYFGGNRQRLPH